MTTLQALTQTMTAGPWTAPRIYSDEHDVMQQIKVYGGTPLRIIAEVRSNPDAQDVANLTAISALPELLAVAQGCLGYFQHLQAQPGAERWAPDASWLAPLIAAIDKAQGK